MKLHFGSKAATLELLYGNLKCAHTLPVYRFFEKDFYENTNKIVQEIKMRFADDGSIAVRSSAANEDALTQSNAGAFESILNVDATDLDSITVAIKSVLESYDKRDPNNEVFCQPMLRDVALAGVAFSCDLSTLAPYYVINYDESGKTNVITSGSSNETKTYVSYKNAETKCKDVRINFVINAVKELEGIFENNYIDVEFAVTNNDKVYILQARPISINGRKIPKLNLDIALLKINHKIMKLQSENPNVFGKRAIFGVMPDWNPAEMIGIRPKKLALSLYKELITDNIWAYQRDNYGYLNLRSHPLLISFLGVPFIDVRADFNSFIPKCMDKKVANKLVKFYLDKLYKIPSYHDKVEFKIVYSCYHLNIDDALQELTDNEFSDVEIYEIKRSLRELTNEIVSNSEHYYKADLQKTEMLKQKHDEIVNSDLYIVDKIYWLIEHCKRYGTLPFSGVARSAFIAVQFLQSFVALGIITQDEYGRYMNSLDTVSKKFVRDLRILDKDKFLKIWGHLRPGTYDINSMRYDEGFEHYFANKVIVSSDEDEEISFKFSESQREKIQNALSNAGIGTNVSKLLEFIKESIEGREYSKFIFTRTLSQILLYIEELAEKFEISREDAAFIDIKVVQQLYSSLDFMDVAASLKQNIDYNKLLFEYTKAVKLPSIILSPDEVYGFFLEKEEPNFVTLKSVRADVVLENEISSTNLAGKIAFIKSADPGYDFLFTKNIAGLVTQYGGANSHMAIRCAEFGIPAVIGAGEKSFEEWSSYNTIEIDCINRKVVQVACRESQFLKD